MLRIQLKKGRDGPSTLTCVRADGSRTWGSEHPFFPLHDLTHCAVESVFGFDQAFFGLIARGWEIDDFVQPGASARLPSQAIIAEHVVGVFDRERALPRPLTAAEFNETIAASLALREGASFAPVTDEQLTGVRTLRDALQGQWAMLALGDTLAVEFPATVADLKMARR